MCGILLILRFLRRDRLCEKDGANVSIIEDSSYQSDIYKLLCRGPNDFKEVFMTFGTDSNDLDSEISLGFQYSILHLRGSLSSRKYISGSTKNTLLWNGEIFDGLKVKEEESDTEVLYEKLNSCSNQEEILSVLSTIRGPFAFAYYAEGFLWFGRDILGRRSLVWNCEKGCFSISSVVRGTNKGQEVTTNGILCLDLKQSIQQQTYIIELYPWHCKPSGVPFDTDFSLNHPEVQFIVQHNQSLRSPFTEALNRTLPSHELLQPFSTMTEGGKETEKEMLLKILHLFQFEELLVTFEKVLSNAVEARVKCQNHLCKNCYSIWIGNEQHVCEHSTVGVLFSGGLDSIVIACIADRFASRDVPIDLINVAFAKNEASSNDKVFNTPDRLTGRDGLAALKQVCPLRTWNFVEVNINHSNLISKRKERIVHLLSPSCSVLDDSIGCALWFAARGEGVVQTDDGLKDYASPARILLLGMGADEQLGGYSRHRARFSSSDWSGLIDELSLEIDRIGSRNLGRDDRIIADHGVEARYPFLDEKVVSFLNSLPVWIKMNLNYPRGVGEKLLLRLLAFKLGLTEASTLPKRAIQFGSRIAKLENPKEKGSDVCERLKTVAQ